MVKFIAGMVVGAVVLFAATHWEGTRQTAKQGADIGSKLYSAVSEGTK